MSYATNVRNEQVFILDIEGKTVGIYSILRDSKGLDIDTVWFLFTVVIVILSSFFFKYADTILKKYSSTVATIFTGIASAALFGHKLTMHFVLGISIVFISMHRFFSHLSKGKEETANGAIEVIMDIKHDMRSKDSIINMAAGASEEV